MSFRIKTSHPLLSQDPPKEPERKYEEDRDGGNGNEDGGDYVPKKESNNAPNTSNQTGMAIRTVSSAAQVDYM